MTNRQHLVQLLSTLLAMAFTALASPAAPAPDPSHQAREKFEGLKKKLPAVVNRWIKDNYEKQSETIEAQLALFRRIAPAEAKLTLRFKAILHGKHAPEFDFLVTIYLRYYDGKWTTTRCSLKHKEILSIDDLMLSIDDAGGE